MINFRLIKHLWLFLAVAEEQHFGRAAKRLGMSQPPLTEQIQVLENSLRVKLFERSRRGTYLTPVGKAILPAVKKFAEQVEQLELAVREATSGQTGILTVGTITSAMFDILPALQEKLRSKHPHLTIAVKEIDSTDAVSALESGDIDLAFARLPSELGNSIESVIIAQDKLVVALPVSHPLATKSRIKLSELTDESFVMFSRHLSPVYFDSIIGVCRKHGFSPRILHDVKSVASQLGFVGCGQGISLVHASMSALAPNNIVLVPLAEEIDIVTTTAAWRIHNANPALALVLAELQTKDATA